MAKSIILAFLLDFGLPAQEVKITFTPAYQIEQVVNDPNRGTRKADGICNYDRSVTINLDHWKSINKWQKKELIYHELGHCLLDLGHTNNTSIMNPFTKKMYHVRPDGSNWNTLVRSMKKQYKSHQ